MSAKQTDNFSGGYVLVNGIEVRTWTEDVAAMPADLYRELARSFPTPLLGRVGGLTYQFDKQERGIPADTIAVPSHNHKGESPETVLLYQP